MEEDLPWSSLTTDNEVPANTESNRNRYMVVLDRREMVLKVIALLFDVVAVAVCSLRSCEPLGTILIVRCRKRLFV
jgi:hypothetical protein